MTDEPLQTHDRRRTWRRKELSRLQGLLNCRFFDASYATVNKSEHRIPVADLNRFLHGHRHRGRKQGVDVGSVEGRIVWDDLHRQPPYADLTK